MSHKEAQAEVHKRRHVELHPHLGDLNLLEFHL
jgi:hypothetical protein